MESIYAALLLHKTGGKITAANVEKVLTAAGAKVDKTEITKLIAGLKGTNLDEIINSKNKNKAEILYELHNEGNAVHCKSVRSLPQGEKGYYFRFSKDPTG